MQSDGFLGRLLGPLRKVGLPLTKNILTELVKSVLIPLGLTAAALTADAGIHKKMLESRTSGSIMTMLIISNKEMKDFMKIVNSLENSSLLI